MKVMDTLTKRVAARFAATKTAASDVPEKLRAALEAIDYMPNAVANWMEAHAGNRNLAKDNAAKVRKAQDLLSEVLASLPAAVEYKNREDLIKGLHKWDIRQMGESESSGLRAELQGQPKFDKLVGPMYGGPGIVRYESGAVNDSLSR